MSPGSFVPFLGEDGASREEDARFVVLPVPYDETTTYQQGCASGPRAVLAASANMESFDEDAEWDLDPRRIFTAPPVPGSPAPERLAPLLEARVRPWAERGAFTVAIGGEHAVTLGPFLAYLKAFPGLSLLQLDAHADLRDKYGGSRWSHACIARRVSEHAPVVQVGVRSLSADEWKARPTLGVQTFLRKDTKTLDERSVEAVLDALSPHVYLSVDIDVFDPAFAPATGTPEPGGLDWYEASLLVRELVRKKTVVAMDVTEVRPEPGDVRTEFLASRLILRVLAWIERKEAGAE